MDDTSNVPADKLTKAYIKIRSERAALSAGFKEKDGELIRQQEILKRALLDYCDSHSVESVRTTEGLFFRSTKTKYWTGDWESMYGFIKEHDMPEFLDRRLNQTNVKQFLEENPDVMPKGLNIDTEYVISVRKK
jgi:Zn/Cd-binding protein ZinT